MQSCSCCRDMRRSKSNGKEDYCRIYFLQEVCMSLFCQKVRKIKWFSNFCTNANLLRNLSLPESAVVANYLIAFRLKENMEFLHLRYKINSQCTHVKSGKFWSVFLTFWPQKLYNLYMSLLPQINPNHWL